MERYTIEPSTRPGQWACTDNENSIACTFKDGEFNETQESVHFGVERPDVMAMARYMREMGDWLRENHYDKIFP